MKQHNTRSRAAKAKKATLKEIEALSQQEKLTVGIDIGDRFSRYCIVSSTGATLIEGKLATKREELSVTFKGFAKTTAMAMEAGTHSPWISRYLKTLGFDPIVGNPRRLALISQTKRKNDKVDAQKLAMLAQTNARLLYPIQHRGEQAQADLAAIRGREELVRLRTSLINCARGQAKAAGYRLESCDAAAVKPEMADHVPEMFRETVKRMLATAELVTEQIKAADQQIHRIAKRYPEIQLVTEIWGVGQLTALDSYLFIVEQNQ